MIFPHSFLIQSRRKCEREESEIIQSFPTVMLKYKENKAHLKMMCRAASINIYFALILIRKYFVAGLCRLPQCPLSCLFLGAGGPVAHVSLCTQSLQSLGRPPAHLRLNGHSSSSRTCTPNRANNSIQYDCTGAASKSIKQ